MTFIVVGFFCFIFNRRKTINLFFIFDIVFLLFCVLQTKYFSLNKTVSIDMIKTYSLCVLSYFALLNYILFKKNILKFLKLYLYANIIALLLNFFFDFDQLFSGRFGSGDGIVVFGQQIGGVTAISTGWMAGILLCICFVIYIFDKKDSKYWATSLFLITTILLSGTRKALIFILAFIILNVFISKKRSKETSFLKFLLSLFIVVLLYFLIMNISLLS